MSNAASFNLLKFVERNPALNARKIVGIWVLCAAVLLTYFFFQTKSIRDAKSVSVKLQQDIQRSVSSIQPQLQNGDGNSAVGVLLSDPRLNQTGFYPEFQALSHIQVKGLWLEEVMIDRRTSSIKIIGAMDAADKLDPLLKQLALQPAFKNVHFVGSNVHKGLLPDVPPQYQQTLKKLKIPKFYRFVIQTTPLNQPEGNL